MITVIPSSKNHPELYIHRNTDFLTTIFSGTQYIKAINGEPELVWDIWHNYICISINEKIVAFFPQDEIVNIQLNGKTSSKRMFPLQEEVVTYSLALNEYIPFKIHRRLGGSYVVYSTEYAEVMVEEISVAHIVPHYSDWT